MSQQYCRASPDTRLKERLNSGLQTTRLVCDQTSQVGSLNHGSCEFRLFIDAVMLC